MRGKKRGRQRAPLQLIWSTDPFDRKRSVTSAVISMCIKEDFNQTLPELAMRLSELKGRSKSECLAVLRDLKKRGHLGFWDDEFTFRLWSGGRKGRKNEKGSS